MWHFDVDVDFKISIEQAEFKGLIQTSHSDILLVNSDSFQAFDLEFNKLKKDYIIVAVSVKNITQFDANSD